MRWIGRLCGPTIVLAARTRAKAFASALECFGRCILVLVLGLSVSPIAVAENQYGSDRAGVLQEIQDLSIQVANLEMDPSGGVARIENIIPKLERLLELETPLEAFHENVVQIHQDLGMLYWNRLTGDRPQNQERGLAHLQLANQCHLASPSTSFDERRKRVDDCLSLAALYTFRIAGDRDSNLQHAMAAVQVAEGVTPTPAAGVYEWADIQVMKADIVLAPDWSFDQQTLTQITDDLVKVTRLLPGDADAQERLARLYVLDGARPVRDRVELSIKALERAKDLQGPSMALANGALLAKWWKINLDLARAYAIRIDGDPHLNLETSLQYYSTAVDTFGRLQEPGTFGSGVSTDEDPAQLGTFPGQIARFAQDALSSSVNLQPISIPRPQQAALVLVERGTLILRSKEANAPERADEDFAQALSLLGKVGYTRERISVLKGHAAAAAAQGHWSVVMSAAREAEGLGRSLIGDGFDARETAQISQELSGIAALGAYAAWEVSDWESAWSFIAWGRARSLQLALRQDTLQLPDEARSQLQLVKSNLATLARREVFATGGERENLLTDMERLRERASQIVATARPTATEPIVDKLVRATADGAILVAPVSTEQGGVVLACALIDGHIRFFSIASESLETARVSSYAQRWLEEYQSAISATDGSTKWKNLLTLAAQFQNDAFGVPLTDLLKQAEIHDGGRVKILNSGVLSLFPLILTPINGAPLGARYVVSDVTTLDARGVRSGPRAGTNAAIVANPAGDLPFARIEGEIVASFLGGEVADGGVSFTQELQNASVWHFATHGYYNWASPLDSGLLLAAGARLTLRDIAAMNVAAKLNLIFLSACESGIVLDRRNPDEFIGLPTAFISLGAAHVVGSLWPVEDRSTTLLVMRFYQGLREEGLDPPEALQRAQNWLAGATGIDLAAFVSSQKLKGRLPAHDAASLLAGIVVGSERPFADPYFWGAFVVYQ